MTLCGKVWVREGSMMARLGMRLADAIPVFDLGAVGCPCGGEVRRLQ